MLMNPSGGAEWNPQVEEELGSAELQGIRFSRVPPQQRRPGTMQENKGLFVRNVPRDMTNKDLKHVFSEYGTVLSVFLKLNGPGARFNWAIATTESVKDMLSIMSALNKKPPFNFEITVALTEDEKKKRRENDFFSSQNSENRSVVKRDVENFSAPGASALLAQLSRREAAEAEQVRASWPQMNGAFEVGRGNVMMEGGRHQACVFCKAQGKLRCSVCKAWYCSMVCQVDDWYHHKDTCRSPPILDDPNKVQNSLCAARCEDPRESSATVLPPVPPCTNGHERNHGLGLLGEAGLCSGPMSGAERAIQPTRSFGSLPENNFDRRLPLPKASTLAEISHGGGRGAISKRSLAEEGSYGAGRGSIPIRNSMAENRFAGGCDTSPKRSIPIENGHVMGRGAIFSKDTEKSSALKYVNPRSSLGELGVGKVNVESNAATQNLEHPTKVSVAEKTAPPVNAIVSTPAHSPSKEDSASPTVPEAKSPAVSTSENAAEKMMSFGSLVEKGNVYNGFITVVTSHEQFIAVAVVEGTECIFGEADETLSPLPADDNFKPEVGVKVAAYSPTEDTWYRACVLAKDGPNYRVCFIDFGNKETVQQVKPLPKGPFSELPELAFSAKLYTKITDQVQEKLKEMVQVDNALKFKVIAKKGFSVKVALCDPEDEGDTAVAEYIFAPLSVPDSCPPQPAAAPPPDTKAAPPPAVEDSRAPDAAAKVANVKEQNLSPQKEITSPVHAGSDASKENGLISAAQVAGISVECKSSGSPQGNEANKLPPTEAGKPRPFFVAPMKNVDLILKLEELSVAVNQQCESSPASPHQPGRGEACLAKFTEDGTWYRGLCVASADASSQVLFVDYGNTENVSHTDIRPIQRQFMELPCMALFLPQHGKDGETNSAKEGQTDHCTLPPFTLLTSMTLPLEEQKLG